MSLWNDVLLHNNNRSNTNIVYQCQCLQCCHHDHSHCWSSCDECRLGARWPPTNPQTRWIDLSCGSTCRLLLSTSIITIHCYSSILNADAHFTIQWKVESWVDLGTAGRVHCPCSTVHQGQHNWHEWYLILKSHITFSLRHVNSLSLDLFQEWLELLGENVWTSKRRC